MSPALADHPVARALAARALLARHALAAAATLGAAIVGELAGAPRATALLIAAAVAALGFGAALLAVEGTVRSRAVAALAAGEERVVGGISKPLVQRLCGRRVRQKLARSLERAVQDAHGRVALPAHLRPVGALHHLPQARDQIDAVVALLRREAAVGARGVALCQRLVCDGLTSPLYGGQVEPLRHELRRIAFALEAA
jgi:hypothetical protein